MKLCVLLASERSNPTHVGGAPHAQQLVSGLLKPPPAAHSCPGWNSPFAQ